MEQYSIYKMIKDIVIGFINSPLANVICGALIGLLANPILHHLSDIKTKKEKQAKILEEIQFITGKFVEYFILKINYQMIINFFGRALDIEPNNGLAREEVSKTINLLNSTNEKLIDFRGELRKLYMSYKIYFEKDAALKAAINKLITYPYPKINGYETTTNIQTLVDAHNKYSTETQESLSKSITNIAQELLDYLDTKIEKILNK